MNLKNKELFENTKIVQSIINTKHKLTMFMEKVLFAYYGEILEKRIIINKKNKELLDELIKL